MLTNPATVSEMDLTLAEVRPYDRNPRKEPNPEYEDIKRSIRFTKKLNNIISVTRRPGDEKYMILSGGNTRLQILNELYHETGDEDFNRQKYIFKPWESELHTLSAHLIENGLRGEVMLIDKAYAVMSMKTELEAEKGRELSINEFAALSTETGYKISRRMVARLKYAIELDQMIPQFLRSGLGSGRIDQIKKLHQAYIDYCNDKTDQLEIMFLDVMSQHDGEMFDLDLVRKDLDRILEHEIGVTANVIYLEIQSRTIKSSGEYNMEAQPAFDPDPLVLANSASEDPLSGVGIEQHSDVIDTENRDEQGDKMTLPAISSQPSNEKVASTAKADLDLNDLRRRNYELACTVAKPYELDHVIFSTPNGLGFYVECVDYAFEEKHAIRFMVWWMLMSISEQDHGADSNIRKSVWAHTDLARRVEEDSRNNDLSLAAHVGKAPNILSFTPMLFQNPDDLNDNAFTGCFKLIANIRKTKAYYSGETLWVETQ